MSTITLACLQLLTLVTSESYWDSDETTDFAPIVCLWLTFDCLFHVKGLTCRPLQG